jgi:hypothetical protein
MTEETRKQLEELAYCGHRKLRTGAKFSTSFLADCNHCSVDFYDITRAYELGEKAGRSAQKAEDNSYGNGTCSGVDLVG